MQPVLSICVPTYNGEDTLPHLLESIVSQAGDYAEIVICDDQSGDGTVSVAREYAARYPYIHVYENDKNLGMDGNFLNSVRHARGEYVWLSGQDDIFEEGALEKFYAICNRHPEVDFIFFNYRTLGDDMEEEALPPELSISNDMYVHSAKEFFDVIDYAPSFLNSAITRRKFWDIAPVEEYFDTFYVQMGVWLYCFHDKNTYVVADPSYVTCRNPFQSWKYQNGQMLFEIRTGQLEVYYRTLHDPVCDLPDAPYLKKKRDFLRNYPFRVIKHKTKGLRVTQKVRRQLKLLFGDNRVLYYCYILPIIHIPPVLCYPLVLIASSKVTKPVISLIKNIVRKVFAV